MEHPNLRTSGIAEEGYYSEDISRITRRRSIKTKEIRCGCVEDASNSNRQIDKSVIDALLKQTLKSIMKFTYISIITAFVILVQADNAWYVPSRNITCSGHADGHIACESGHLQDAPEVYNHVQLT